MFQTTNQLISGPIAYNLIVSTPAFIRLLVGCLLEGETYILVTRTNHLFWRTGPLIFESTKVLVHPRL
jgi:hypothetical protein